jgi:ATP-binding protein involved in chromosome partitioning
MTDSATLHQELPKSLEQIRDPDSGRPLSETGQVTDWQIAGGHVRCQLALTSATMPLRHWMVDQITQRFHAQAQGIQSVQIDVVQRDRPYPAIGQIGLKARHVIAVGSGKGGVGKSTVAASLALALEKLGARVGLMDADIYGPSIPHLLGLSGRPEIIEGKIQPIRLGKMPVLSMGFLVERHQAVIWRGPMLHGSLTQFLRDTAWGELDYLVIDLPPGTGDVVLTLSQLVPLAGAVVVCTPQEVALLDADKAIAMFDKTKVPLLGLVENMSGFTCPDTGKTYAIFGKGGTRARAEQLGVPLLAEIPIQMPMRELSDEGGLARALEVPEVGAIMEKLAVEVAKSIADQTFKRPVAAAPLPVLG